MKVNQPPPSSRKPEAIGILGLIMIVELGVVIGKNGRDISKADAEGYIAGYTLAIDLTARNVQDAVKKQGYPWSTAKGFDTFTPIG